MRRNRRLLPALLTLLLLTGCSLARAEAAPEDGDRWVGFYVVPSKGGRDGILNNPYWEEYGSSTVEIEGMGNFAFPNEVLFAVEDEAGNYTFPGIDVGFSLFFLETVEEHGPCTHVVSNMGPHENGVNLAYKDEGKSVTLSGTVYCGPPLGAADWDPYTDGTIWEFFRVYQTPDGRVYINGSGDSTNGPMTHTVTEKRTSQKNGETVQEETLSVTAAIEAVPRLERLVVTQFDGENQPIRADDLALREELPALRCQPEAAWVLVEEIRSEETLRTAYTVPGEGEEPISHQLVLLDDDGWGWLAYLSIAGCNM